MVFVPGFKHDVFISYAQVAEPEWVKAFLGQLQKHLDRELLQTGASSIFWDRRDLEGDSPLSAEITQSIGSSATLVIVLSKAYLDRPWCRKEREAFFGQAGVGSRRAFLVLLEDVSLAKRPREISEMDVLGFQFYEQSPYSEKKGINRPLLIQNDGPFDGRIRELALKLSERLMELKAHPPAKNGTGGNPSRRWLVGAKVFVADGLEGPRVKDLEEARSQLRNWLAEFQIVVLPERHGTLYEQFVDPAQRNICITLAEGVMKEATVVVQLLGASGDEDGYESWLCDRAQAVGKSTGKDLLLWRPQSLKEASVKSASHRELVFNTDLQVIACDLADFQNLVANRVEDIGLECEARLRVSGNVTEKAPDGTGEPRHSVLVDAAPEDGPLVENFRKALNAVGIEYEPAQGAYDFDEMARSGVFDGVAFAFGKCSEEWVNQRLKATRPFRLTAKPKQRPRVGVYRERTGRELTGTKGVDVIIDGIPETLTDFVAKLRAVAR